MIVWPFSEFRPRIVEISHPKTKIEVSGGRNGVVQVLFEDRSDAFILITDHEIAARLYLALEPVVGDHAVWLGQRDDSKSCKSSDL